MRLHTKAFALSVGAVSGVMAFVMTNVVAHATLPESQFRVMLLPGYSLSFAGSLFGSLYAFLTGSIAGGCVSFLYNRIYGLLVPDRSRPPLPSNDNAPPPALSNETTLAPRATNLEKAAQHWGHRAHERQDANMPITAWTDSLAVQRLYIHPTISGRPDENWLTWVARKYFPHPVERALSIGCGDGGLERHALQLNVAREFDALDISPAAVELARAKIDEMGQTRRVCYAVADMNRHRLARAKYDVVFASMGLHHIEALEHALEEIRQSLKAGGLFILNEFVGPSKFQWTDTQLRVANELLRQIPENYRRSVRNGEIKSQVSRPTPEHMEEVDPTESVRSAEIVPLVSTFFDVVERVDYGGTIVNLVLEDIAGNFGLEAPDVAVLQALVGAEQQMLRCGAIPSDFTLMITKVRE
jgi:SAM-dependent methyltransferase